MSDSKSDSELAPRSRLVPTYAARGIEVDIPKYEMPEQSMLPSTAYQIIHDELRLDGYSMLNLATFEHQLIPEFLVFAHTVLSKNLETTK